MTDNNKKSSGKSAINEGFIKKGGLGKKPLEPRPKPPAAHVSPSDPSDITEKKSD